MERPITIRDLIKYDIPEAAVNGWIDAFNERVKDGKPSEDYKLTDLQSHALGHPETLYGSSNLLIAGPTSSGKTLIAEAIVAAALARNQKAKILYLVPLRSLVTEKWEQFRAVFETQKIVKEGYIVPLSGDYPSSDHTIARGTWNVAILVFDKLYRWLADERRLRELVSDVDLVIVDELQVIEEGERGEKLESILSVLLWLQEYIHHNLKPRIVAMAASDTTENDTIKRLENWLHAIVVPNQHTRRPVRLLEGWMIPSGTLKNQELIIYENPSSLLLRRKLSSEEYPKSLQLVLKKLPPIRSCYQLAVILTMRFVAQKLRVLIYVASKSEARNVALSLQRVLLKSGTSGGINPAIASGFEELENTQVKKWLGETLQAGVGFHYSDMTDAERRLVEEGFRQRGTDPPVSVVVATSTLSMGVNLPADIVLMRDQHTYKILKNHSNQHNHHQLDRREASEQPLSIMAYRNFAGRAGRNRPDLPEDAFGLALLLARKEKRNVIDKLLYGKVKPLVSQLNQPMFGYHPHVLIILAVVSLRRRGEMISEEAVLEVLQQSYAWTDNKMAEKLRHGVSEVLVDLKGLLLINDKNNLNGTGKAAASHHLSYGSAQGLLMLADELYELWPRYPLDLLYRVADLPEVQAEYPRFSDLPPGDSEKRQRLEKNLRAFFKARTTPNLYADNPLHPFRLFLHGRATPTDEELLKLIRTAVIWGWLKGVPSSQLEDSRAFPKLYMGPLKRLGERLAFCISALRSLYLQTLRSEIHTARQLWLFEQALRFGVPPEIVTLPTVVSHSSNKQIARETCMEIWASIGGWVDARNLIGMAAPSKVFSKTWETVQQGLFWWKEEVKKIWKAPPDSEAADVDEEEMTEDFGMMLHALEDYSTGAYTRDFARLAGQELDELATDLLPTGQAEVGLTVAHQQMLLERTHQRIARFPIHEYDGLRRLALSALERKPLSMNLDPVYFGSLLLVLKMDEHWLATVMLMMGKPGREELKSLPNNSRLMIICGEAPGVGVQIPKKVALLLTIEALVAASEFVGDQPRYRPRLLEVLSTHRGNILSVEEMLKLIVSDKTSPLERIKI